MKRFLILLLLIATTCFATERFVFLSGDSEGWVMSPQLPPPGDGYECIELITPVVGSPICEIFPGEWVNNGAWMAEHAIQPDRACYALGCNYGYAELNGTRFKGHRAGFLAALRHVLSDEAEPGGFKENDTHPQPPGSVDLPRDGWEGLTPPDIVIPREITLRTGDVLHVWLQGSAGMADIDGVIVPCFYLAWPDDEPAPPCESFGGEILVP
ncbi:unnamed protein product, partial [marine sediment metagenome]